MNGSVIPLRGRRAQGAGELEVVEFWFGVIQAVTQRYFATTAPGFEGLLAREVASVGGKKLLELEGGVEFDATHKTLYRACYELRLAERVLLRVDAFRSRDFPEMYNKVRRFGWERLLGGGHRVRVKAAAHRSRLMHTGRIRETVKSAIEDRFREELRAKAPVIDDPEGAQYLLVRVVDDRCELSLDAAGELLHRRGWRRDVGEAPLRETLAAAILGSLGWNGSRPLLDPMCGSGTLPLEAARLASGRPAGELREFAFQRWANYREGLWREVIEQAAGVGGSQGEVMIFGSDIDGEVLSAARANAVRAGVDGAVRLSVKAVDDQQPPVDRPGLMVCNPPYGRRIGHPEEGEMAWKRLLRVFAARFEGWELGVLLPTELTPGYPGLRCEVREEFRHGGLRVRLWGVEHR